MYEKPQKKDLANKNFIAYIDKDNKITLYDKYKFDNPINSALENDNGIYTDLQNIKNENDLKVLINNHSKYLTLNGRHTHTTCSYYIIIFHFY